MFTAAQKLRQTPSDTISAIVGGLTDAGMWIVSGIRLMCCFLESMMVLKDLLNRLNSENLYTEESYASENGGADLRLFGN